MISHLLLYLACHKRLGIIFRKLPNSSPKIIELYTDADYGADQSRKSTTGFVLKFHNKVVSWTSRLQSSIAESSTEAELNALTEGTREALFLLRLQEDLLSIQEYPFMAYEDNTATYENCVSLASPNRLKHVESLLFKPQEYVQQGLMRLTLVGSLQQLADILTKPLPQTLFLQLRNQLMYDDSTVH